jgi:hypothetical protein
MLWSETCGDYMDDFGGPTSLCPDQHPEIKVQASDIPISGAGGGQDTAQRHSRFGSNLFVCPSTVECPYLSSYDPSARIV